MLATWRMLREWATSSWPGISPFSMAVRASARSLCDTSSGAVGTSPGSGIAVAGAAVRSAASSPPAAAATPSRLRRVRESGNRITVFPPWFRSMRTVFAPAVSWQSCTYQWGGMRPQRGFPTGDMWRRAEAATQSGEVPCTPAPHPPPQEADVLLCCPNLPPALTAGQAALDTLVDCVLVATYY